MNLRRQPSVAGTYYPKSRADLIRVIEESFLVGPGSLPATDTGRREILGGIVSNAHYMYSGPCSAYFFKELKEDGRPETFVIMGPIYRRVYEGWALFPSGAYATPLGDASIDEQLAQALIREAPFVKADPELHRMEEGVEVQVPFLQYLYGDVRILPLLGSGDGAKLGAAIARAVEKTGRDAVILASCSGDHYLTNTETRSRDRKRINAIVRMDIDEFWRLTRQEFTAWNAPDAVVATIAFARRSGVSRCKLLHYATSYDALADRGSPTTPERANGYVAFALYASPALGEWEHANRIGRYKILRKLAEGGMGTALLSEDCDLNTQVVLKILTSARAMNTLAVERFQREARAQAKLRGHPHIVNIYDVGLWRGSPYLAMEYVDGGSLRDLLSQPGGLPINQALAIFHQICCAIEYAHTQGVIHRDLKPENILLTRTGNAKVADFGLAKVQDATTLTLTGQVMGTLAYMAPEQRRGGVVDRRSDIYSLGVLLCKMLTSQRPGGAEECQNLLAERATKEEICALASKALCSDPNGRFQTIGELKHSLHNVMQLSVEHGVNP